MGWYFYSKTGISVTESSWVPTLAVPTTVVTGNSYTPTLGTDYVMFVDTAAGGVTINLPIPASSGQQLIVSDSAGLAATRNITIDPNGASTVNGSTTLVMNTNYQSVHLISKGTNWVTIV